MEEAHEVIIAKVLSVAHFWF